MSTHSKSKFHSMVLLVAIGLVSWMSAAHGFPLSFPQDTAERNTAERDGAPDYFGIRVIDADTGRGVPLVELETVNKIRYVTDSAGWIAIDEPSFRHREVFFFVRSHGYEFEKDGFGYAGTKIRVEPGKRSSLKIRRVNLAERLYRITGAGIYRDSLLLGELVPAGVGSSPAGDVLGQDSAFAVPYRGKLYWFWGDTSRMNYPLGQFWMSGATSTLPTTKVADHNTIDPEQNIDLKYFVDEDGFSKPMARLGVQTGVIWADGFLTLTDPQGQERLLCHYAHMASLDRMLAHGLAVYDDEREEFQVLSELDLAIAVRYPAQAHPFRHVDAGVEYLYFGEVVSNVRVRARWDDYLNPEAWEALTCRNPDDPNQVMRDSDGRLNYEWRRDAKPIGVADEKRLLQTEVIGETELRFHPIDIESGLRIELHRGSVAWNPFRQRWIMIAGQLGGSSNLGEIYYAEADAPEGPWLRAIKIVSHNQYSFYNPVHHREFDQQGGRVIYFEGTYTQTFSDAPVATPRYDYNQILYRLDLGDPRLAPIVEK